jgi:hypothetical protein
VESHDQYHHVSSVRLFRLLRLPVGSVAHWNCFAEFFFGTLPSGVFVGNRFSDEGAKALGDALKENTTVTSLLLNFRGE